MNEIQCLILAHLKAVYQIGRDHSIKPQKTIENEDQENLYSNGSTSKIQESFNINDADLKGSKVEKPFFNGSGKSNDEKNNLNSIHYEESRHSKNNVTENLLDYLGYKR